MKVHVMAMQSRRRRRKLRSPESATIAEHLETRALLTGNVVASVEGGVLNLVGDDDGSDLIITSLDTGQISVVGQNGTTVNGGDDFQTEGTPLTIRGRLGNGDDSVEVVDVEVDQDIIILTSAGNDAVFIAQSAAQNVVVRSGQGVDLIEFDDVAAQGNLVGRGDNGSDTVRVLNSAAAGDLRVAGGNGRDSLQVNASTAEANIEIVGNSGVDVVEVSESSADGDLVVRTGAGRDAIGLVSVDIEGGVQIRSGAAADIVGLADVNATDAVFANLASGGDIFTLSGDNNFDGSFEIGAGNGQDVNSDRSDSTFAEPPEFQEFEAQQLSDANIAAGLQAFSDANLLIGPTLFVEAGLSGSNNVVFDGDIAFLALGTAGIGALNTVTGEFTTTSQFIPNVDDLSIGNGFLFVLDAVGTGTLQSYDISNPLTPLLLGGGTVPVSPFAGVSAAGGRAVVSGGTGLLTVVNFDTQTGIFLPGSSTIDLGIGQPDVLLSEDGSQAVVSVDFAGTVDGSGFGVTIIDLNDTPVAPTVVGSIGLDGAGFTGSQGPANFAIESALLPDDLFLTAHAGGLTLANFAAEEISTIDVGFNAINVDTLGSIAYVVGQGQLREIDFSDPANPVLGEIQDFDRDITGVAVNEDFVVLAANGDGTLIRPR